MRFFCLRTVADTVDDIVAEIDKEELRDCVGDCDAETDALGLLEGLCPAVVLARSSSNNQRNEWTISS